MNREDRAKQFAPFEALKGLRDALRKKEDERERVKKKDISEERTIEIQKNLFKINKGCHVYIKYYEDGVYKELDGIVGKKDLAYKYLIVNDNKIFFDDLYFVKIKKF